MKKMTIGAIGAGATGAVLVVAGLGVKAYNTGKARKEIKKEDYKELINSGIYTETMGYKIKESTVIKEEIREIAFKKLDEMTDKEFSKKVLKIKRKHGESRLVAATVIANEIVKDSIKEYEKQSKKR